MRNNFKQIGLGLLNYESAHASFPPAEIYSESPWFVSPTWSAYILPFMESTAIYDQYNYSQGYNSPGDGFVVYGEPTNVLIGGNRIAAYVCPSDPTDGLIDSGTRAGGAGRMLWSKTNAGGVADSQNAWEAGQLLQIPKEKGDGMLMNRKAIRVSDVSDGTSNTLFVGEVTGNTPDTTGPKPGRDPSTVSWTWAGFGSFSTHFGINGTGTIPGEGVFSRTGDDGFSSYHPGGCHFLMVNGSVQFLSRNTNADVLTATCTRAGGETINAGL